MAQDKITRRALEIGRANADEVISFRTKALRRRSQALSKRTAASLTREAAPLKIIPKLIAAARGSTGTLIAEGDSWFDYPWTDIIRILEDEH